MLRHPRARALIVRKTRVSLSESALFTYEKYVLGADSPMAQGPQRAFRRKYTYPNGSEVITGGMDKASRIMSTEFDLIYIPEATELDVGDWEALISRLRNNVMPYQQIIADCNPGPPKHWLKQRADAGTCRLIESRHEDNPVLYDHERGEWTPEGERYLSKLRALTGVRKQRLHDGLWVQSEGAVYADYGPAHLIDSFEVPRDWRRFRSIDFGYNHPFVCQWWAEDPDGRLYLYREIYRTHRIVEDHAADIARLSRGEKITATVADHDAEDRATLERHGIHTIAASKAVSTGIQTVQERLRVQDDGKPRLFIMRDALVEVDRDLVDAHAPTCTHDEFSEYVWKTRNGVEEDEPVKEKDHGMDAMRYMVMHIDHKGGVGFLPKVTWVYD
jgi:phage terminase large subunit